MFCVLNEIAVLYLYIVDNRKLEAWGIKLNNIMRNINQPILKGLKFNSINYAEYPI